MSTPFDKDEDYAASGAALQPASLPAPDLSQNNTPDCEVSSPALIGDVNQKEGE